MALNMILGKSQEPLMFLSWTTNPGWISSGNCKTVTGVKITSYCVPLTPSHSKDPTCANNWSFNWDFWHSNMPHRSLFTITCRCLHFCTKLISMQWQFKFWLCIIIRYQPVKLLNGIQSSDRSIPISETTDSKLLDARANQTWTAMHHLWPASAVGILPVWVPESPCFQSTWWPLMTTPACCFPDEVPRKPTQMAQGPADVRTNTTHWRLLVPHQASMLPTLNKLCTNYGHIPWNSKTHRENMSAKLRVTSRGNCPNLYLTPIWQGKSQLGCYQCHQPIVLGRLWRRFWSTAID